MECLFCAKKLGVLRKLKSNEFCSVAHRKAYAKKQNDEALDFLMKSRPRLRPSTKPVSALGSSAPAAVEPKPQLVLAQFVAELVAPGLVSARPIRNTQPVEQVRAAILPAGAHAAGPRLIRSHCASLAIVANVAPAHGPRLSPRLSPKGPAPFVPGRPRVRVSVVHPIWIAPDRPVAAKRPRAGFVTVRPTWIDLASHPLRAGAAAKFAIRPAIVRTELAPHRPAFPPAAAKRPSPKTSASPGHALERNRSAWQRHTAEVHMLSATTAPGASGLRLCGRISVAPPPSCPAPRYEAAAIVFGPMAAPERALTRALPFIPRTLSLGLAPPAHLDPPSPAAPLSATISGIRVPLIFNTAMALGAFKRVSPLRPFDTPPLTTPIRSVMPEPQDWANWRLAGFRRLAGYWWSAPRWSHRLAVAVPVISALVIGAGRLQTSTGVRDAQAAMAARISRRAVVEVGDDFRSGLSRWTGAPGWAGSWSYDATGFARPGRLALLSRSLPMDDYRLEFLVQIEKKAIGWVYRAADIRNYYAMKLVVSNDGPAAVYSIVRYAVIDGHQRLKIQLPLPLTASSKTMLRVRQEIRDAQFTTYLDGRLVDTWSDPTLARGGIGFFADPGEAAHIRWVEVAHNDDALGRICSYMAGRIPD